MRCAGVSVEISAKRIFLAIMGASGSGKSTFMKHTWFAWIAPSSGKYLLEGIDVSKHDKKGAGADPQPKKSGLCFQGF